MKIVEKILKKRWYYHSLIWLLSVLIIFVFLASESTDIMDKIIDTVTIIVPSMILTYLLFYFKDYFFSKKQYVSFGIVAIMITVAMGYFAAYFSAYLYDEVKLDTRQWVQNMFIMAFIVVVSRIAKKGIISQLELQKLQVEKLKMEIHLLKAQLNPHFLFNTINNICGVNQVNSEKSTEMLINLAELLRYHLEFSAVHKIPVRKEIQLIEAFIELEKMRLRNNCSVKFERSKTDIETSIAPLLLLPFVENAFKHGTHTSLPSFIHIKLSYNQSGLELIIENSLFKNQKVSKNNIGQKNTIKRLQLIYPDRHQLVIEEKDETYLVHLNINL
ncbi:histidine kinase [Aquimarina sp. MAR_2010_214]|uniref:sensor histidine kinase n=1 Tax=Aquimarina sp. MAR_2010_214 TaxID=1250026 RepID=UPI000C706936|nr:histidine kinase [Aquimarina sp. MAR_2010_214]PKV52835.1 histidine kinase [Aquimarina sp. MAR_2010_214]